MYELTKQCADDARREADAFLEPRYSVYGNNTSGWSDLAKWIRRWRVDETTHTLLAAQVRIED